MQNHSDAAPDHTGAHAILASLEAQLAALDRLGARIAAAHCDAAIQQLRLDMTRTRGGIFSVN